MLRFAEMGYKTIGIDIDQSKVDFLNAAESYIEHIPTEKISKNKKNIQATTDFSAALEADTLILCVPTPLNKYREPDLSYVLGTLESLLPFLRPGQVVSLESTTYPGTTEEELKPRIEKCGFKVGQDIFLVFSPEREDPGNPDFETATIPKVVGGSTPACLAIGEALYGAVVNQVVPVSSTQTAEMVKLLENIHRAVNIGLVNEMKIVADKMKIDIHEVINAAATKPFGFTAYYPGPGIGGHCIPIDPFYLTWKAREFGVHTRFIELAGEVNSHMPRWVFIKTAEALNVRKKSINGSSILILGAAYKCNVSDMRESPSLELIELFAKKGAVVSYSDPHVPVLEKMRHHDLQMKSIELTPETLSSFDCVILATAHQKFDYEMIKQHSKLIIDTRGYYHEKAANIVKA